MKRFLTRTILLLALAAPTLAQENEKWYNGFYVGLGGAMPLGEAINDDSEYLRWPLDKEFHGLVGYELANAFAGRWANYLDVEFRYSQGDGTHSWGGSSRCLCI